MSTFGTFASGFTVDEEAQERNLGEFRPNNSKILHFKLYAVGSGAAIVRRFRRSNREPDVVAVVTSSDAGDLSFEWDEWHHEHREDDWMTLVAAWAVATVTADGVIRAGAQS